MSADGQVEPLRPGTCSIRAVLGAFSDELQITLTGPAMSFRVVSPVLLRPSDELMPLVYAGYDRDPGGFSYSRQVASEWASSNPEVLRALPGGTEVAGINTPSFVALGAGDSRLSAMLGGEVIASRTIVVVDTELVSLAVSVTANEFAFHEPPRVAVLASYADGSTYDVTSQVDWSGESTAEFAGHVSESGDGFVFRPAQLGTSTLTASFDGGTASAQLTVLLGTPERLTIQASDAPRPASVSEILFVAAETPPASIEVSDAVSWLVDDPTIARIERGREGRMTVTGLRAGPTQIRAMLSGFSSAPFPIIISDAVLETLSFGAVDEHYALSSESLGMHAEGHFDDGSVHDVTDQCVWQADDPSVAAFTDAAHPEILVFARIGQVRVSATCPGPGGAVRDSILLTVVEQIP